MAVEKTTKATGLHVFLAVVIAVSLAGLVYGFQDSPEPVLPTASQAPQGQEPIPSAPSYSTVAGLRWADDAVPLTDQAGPFALPEAAPIDDAALQQARVTLGERRAFDGAPPVIPHPVQEERTDCIACHVDGLQAEGFRVPQISHEVFSSCTQCHLSADPNLPVVSNRMLTTNSFAGLTAGPQRGVVATPPWPTAPPATPHTTNMRENCASCHGEGGFPTLRTPHPERVSCTQCHVPSADIDLREAREPPFPIISFNAPTNPALWEP